MDDVILLYTTWPDAETAAAAGRAIVEEGLAACANILPAGTSIYRWQGAVEEAAETVMILKTTRAAAETVRNRVLSLHPYELPAIVALPVDAALSHAPFLSWIAAGAEGSRAT